MRGKLQRGSSECHPLLGWGLRCQGKGRFCEDTTLSCPGVSKKWPGLGTSNSQHWEWAGKTKSRRSSRLQLSPEPLLHALSLFFPWIFPVGWLGKPSRQSRAIPSSRVGFAAAGDVWSLLSPHFRALTPFPRFIAGSLAGTTAAMVTYPLDMVRARMAVTPKEM